MDIDVVIPWVDPSDKAWIESKNKYLGIEDLNKIDNSNNRFRDWKNFKYVFRGIDKFMPWVHKIYLVTCGQTPDWMKKNLDDEDRQGSRSRRDLPGGVPRKRAGRKAGSIQVHR